jgi:hypothetical protein
MTIPEMIGVLKDALLAIAAATTAVVAVVGIKNWSRELKGRAQFEAARGLARAVYRLRNELRYCRSPFIAASEFPAGYGGALGKPSPEDEATAWTHVYMNRWRSVASTLEEFDTADLEAEALWGASIRRSTDALRHCVGKLRAGIDSFLSDKSAGGDHFKGNPEFGVQIRRVVPGSASDPENTLSKEIEEAIQSIEKELRPHLRRGR